MMEMGLADLLVTLTLTATPDSKHLEAALIMLVRYFFLCKLVRYIYISRAH
jgi:antibiotic biosynthesis monooxygenase (ABM) superfamily enzyme